MRSQYCISTAIGNEKAEAKVAGTKNAERKNKKACIDAETKSKGKINHATKPKQIYCRVRRT